MINDIIFNIYDGDIVNLGRNENMIFRYIPSKKESINKKVSSNLII